MLTFINKHWAWVLSGFVVLIILLNYKAPPEPKASDFPKVNIRTPIAYQVVPCGRYCEDFISFNYQDRTFEFSQSNPYYSRFEKALDKKGFLTLWFDEKNDNEIYQFSFNRKVIGPFEKLHSISNFDSTVLLLFPIVMLVLASLKASSARNT